MILVKEIFIMKLKYFVLFSVTVINYIWPTPIKILHMKFIIYHDQIHIC